MKQGVCTQHNLQYTLYCIKCEQAFCNNCPLHDHTTLSLLCTLTPELLAQHLKDVNKILSTVDFVLGIIPQVVDGLMEGKRENKEKDACSPFEMLHKDTTRLKELENQANDKAKSLAIITADCDILKGTLDKWMKIIEECKTSVEKGFNTDLREAYEVISQFKGFEKSIKKCSIKVKALIKQIEEVSSVHVKEEIRQRQTFKKLTDYIMNLETTLPFINKEILVKIKLNSSKILSLREDILKLQETRDKNAKQIMGKKEKARKRLAEIELALKQLEEERTKLKATTSTQEELKIIIENKQQELDQVEDNLAILRTIYDKRNINPIPDILQAIKEELDKIMRKRRKKLNELNKYSNVVSECMENVKGVIEERRRELEKELIYRKLLHSASMSEKKFILEEAHKKYNELNKLEVDFADSLLKEKEKIWNVIKSIDIDQEAKKEFQDVIDKIDLGEVVNVLNDIEKSKGDIEESSNIKRTELMTIINNLISVQNSIEEFISIKEAELKKAEEFSTQEDIVYKLISHRRSELNSIISDLNKDNYPNLCFDGRLGKLQLECGHYICLNCYFNKNLERKRTPCLGCGGLIHKISNFSCND